MASWIFTLKLLKTNNFIWGMLLALNIYNFLIT